MASRLNIIIGQKFNMMTIIEEKEAHKKQRQFLCKCDCGHIGIHKLILLTSGQTKSCGCLRKRRFLEINTSHSKSRTKLNFVWQSMKQRCANPNCHAYKYYGGRGISVCEQWSNSLVPFYEWSINNGYKEGLSLDRIDVDGDYCPENCRWVDMKTQSRNKTDNRFIEFKGERMCIQDWANKLGIHLSTLDKRLRKWTLEKALTTPKITENDTKSIRNRQQR